MNLEEFKAEKMTCGRRGLPVTQSKAACAISFMKAQDPELPGSSPLTECRDCELGRNYSEIYLELGGEPVKPVRGQLLDGKKRYKGGSKKKQTPALSGEFLCRYCGRDCGRGPGLWSHESACKKNPNRKKRTYNKKIKGKAGSPDCRNPGAQAQEVVPENKPSSALLIHDDSALALNLEIELKINPAADLKNLFDLRDEIDAAIRARLNL